MYSLGFMSKRVYRLLVKGRIFSSLIASTIYQIIDKKVLKLKKESDQGSKKIERMEEKICHTNGMHYGL